MLPHYNWDPLDEPLWSLSGDRRWSRCCPV